MDGFGGCRPNADATLSACASVCNQLENEPTTTQKIDYHEDESTYIIVEPLLTGEPGTESPEFDLTSSSFNPYAKLRFNKKPDGARGELSGYEPHKTNISRATIRALPQFLFRVTHDGSGGRNEEGHYQSQAIKTGFGKADFYTFPDSEIKESLDAHISQKICHTHWISFTDSITTAIGRGLNLYEKGKENVRIHIIDTFNIKGHPLIVHAYAMLRGYTVCFGRAEMREKMLLASSYVEFLVWDELIVDACSAKLTQLIGEGLLTLLPKLKISRDERFRKGNKPIFKKPSVLRKQLYKLENLKRNDARYFFSTQHMNDHRRVARCYHNPRFEMVMLIGLMSMQTNKFDRVNMVNELLRIPRDQGVFKDLTFFRTGIGRPEKPEVEKFEDIFSDFIIRCGGGGRVRYVAEEKRTIASLFRDPKIGEHATADEDEGRLMSTDSEKSSNKAQDILTNECPEDEDIHLEGQTGEDARRKRRRTVGGSFGPSISMFSA